MVCTLTSSFELFACAEKDAPVGMAEVPNGIDEPSAQGDAGTRPDAGPEVTEFALLENVRISSHEDDPIFQRTRTGFDFGTEPLERATLHVELDTTSYPFERWLEDRPPPGENFPASCDAFDRNFEITIDAPEGSADPPGYEVIRAITPFGGPLSLSADLTEFAHAKPGRHTLEVFIATWSDPDGVVSGSHGGWNVDASLEIVRGNRTTSVVEVIPVFNDSIGPGEEEPSFSFNVPTGANAMRFEYRATGHGSGQDSRCVGPAEEFCQRLHILRVDGEELGRVTPYRADCADLCTLETAPSGQFEYCLENPTGAVESVRAPRAGWCPGDEAPPYVYELDAIEPGEHTLSVSLPAIAQGGSWRISAMAYALDLDAE
jgi:hypothetical protein